MSDSTTVIVSGGTRGLGLAIVEYCLSRGSNVATFARKSTPELEQTLTRAGDRLYFETLDAIETDRLEKFVVNVVARFGGIYGLINNAAIGQDHLLSHIPTAMVNAILTVNLQSPILLTRAVVRQMLLGGGGGRIVNITSICGSRGYAGLTIYSATKGGMDAFTRSLAREVGSRGILVNAIAPGFFESAMSSSLAARQLDTIRRRTPTERLCTESDILPVLGLLLYEQTNTTGATAFVDGGSSI